MESYKFRVKVTEDLGAISPCATPYKKGDWFYFTIEQIWDRKMNNDVVDWSTLGMWTTKTDKNGKEIYGGDRVRNRDGEEELIGKIIWDVDGFIVRFSKYLEVAECENANFVQLGNKDWEIIGTIFDNPDQSKKEK